MAADDPGSERAVRDDVGDLYRRLKDRVEVVEEPHDTFYGMRELIIGDLNRFWMTFGQPVGPGL